MIDIIDIMKQIEHSDTSEERQKEALRLIQEREDEAMQLIQKKQEAYMLNLKEIHRLELEIQIQEIRSRIPKRQIYFGKVKTE